MRLASGDEDATVLSVLAAAHSSGEGLLPFFTSREARSTLRLLCREFRDSVGAFPWADTEPILGDLSVWREVHPAARVANTGVRVGMDDDDLVHLSGIDIVRCVADIEWVDENEEEVRHGDDEGEHWRVSSRVTDAGVAAHLLLARELDVSGHVGITDDGIALLLRARKLTVAGCPLVTGAALASLSRTRSLGVLEVVCVSQRLFTDAATAQLRESGLRVEFVRSPSDYALELGRHISLRDVPDGFRTLQLCLVAVCLSGDALEAVPREIITQEMCLVAVSHHGSALRFVPDHFIDAYLCDVAIGCSNGVAIKYVPERFLTQELCEAAIEHDGWALKYMEERFITLPMCVDAVSFDGFVIEHVPVDFLSEEVIIASLKHSGWLRVLRHGFVRERMTDAIYAAACAVGGAALVAAELAAPPNGIPARNGAGPGSPCSIM